MALIFGNSDAIPVLIDMCTSLVVDVLEERHALWLT